MTAKEKAKWLFDNYYNLKWKLYAHPKSNTIIGMPKDVSKQCALIAVEEILNNSVMNYSGSDFSNNEILSDTDYWQEVKKEINEL